MASSATNDVAAWTMSPLDRPPVATIRPPGSKSLTNRALVLAALATGRCTLSNVLFADDTGRMIVALRKLGLVLDIDEAARTIAVDAPASKTFAFENATLDCGNSGTTIRFLTALLAAAGTATFTLTGDDRMKQRPIGPLLDLLESLAGESGSTFDCGSAGCCPPVLLEAKGLLGGTVAYPAGRVLSSQYLSAACMVGPYTTKECHMRLDGRQLSWPYVSMTMRLMDLFGVTPELERHDETGEPEAIVIPRGRYKGTDYPVEPDASAASYFFGLAAIHPGAKVTVQGIDRHSLQGDADFASVLEQMGAGVERGEGYTTVIGPEQLDGVDVDMSDMPDCAQTLGVVSLFAVGETTMHGLRTLRVKETDRVAALQNELEKLGGSVSHAGDGEDEALTITPPLRVRPATIETYDDHRMAMSFALAATKASGIEIDDPGCVSKTYPEYFADLKTVCGR